MIHKVGDYVTISPEIRKRGYYPGEWWNRQVFVIRSIEPEFRGYERDYFDEDTYKQPSMYVSVCIQPLFGLDRRVPSTNHASIVRVPVGDVIPVPDGFDLDLYSLSLIGVF